MRRALALAVLLLVVASALLLAPVGCAMRRETEARDSSPPRNGSFVDAGDVRMFVERDGSSAGPTAIFVGGTASWSGLWREPVAIAAAHGYRTVALDLPPFGYSTLPASLNFSADQQGQRILRAMDALGLESVLVVTHSFGAAAVMEAVFAAPQRFSGLVLIDPALGLDAPQGARPSTLESVARHEWIAWPATAFLSDSTWTPALLKRMLAEKDRATPELIRLYRQPLALRDSSRGIAHWVPEVLASRGHLAHEETEPYTHLTMPVAIIWGEADAITPLSQGQHLHSLIPRSTLALIPRAGHAPQFEEPQLFEVALANALGAPH
jgi:pimeloyl-ACP methyl ester carboxylesterase